MKFKCQQALLAGAVLLLAGGAMTAGAEDKSEAIPVGVVKATLSLGEFT